jgi:hypothetical protein
VKLAAADIGGAELGKRFQHLGVIDAVAQVLPDTPNEEDIFAWGRGLTPTPQYLFLAEAEGAVQVLKEGGRGHAVEHVGNHGGHAVAMVIFLRDPLQDELVGPQSLGAVGIAPVAEGALRQYAIRGFAIEKALELRLGLLFPHLQHRAFNQAFPAQSALAPIAAIHVRHRLPLLIIQSELFSETDLFNIHLLMHRSLSPSADYNPESHSKPIGSYVLDFSGSIQE